MPPPLGGKYIFSAILFMRDSKLGGFNRLNDEHSDHISPIVEENRDDDRDDHPA